MAQTQEVRGVATTIDTSGPMTVITYHNTPVVTFNAKRILLRTGGYETATTKLRMNQAASQFRLGYKVYQKDDEWYVRVFHTGNIMPFPSDGVLEIARGQ